MKKFFLIAFAVMIASVSSAQSIEQDLLKSLDRATKLEGIIKDYKPCGNEKIDGYGKAVQEAAKYAILNSVQLDSMYKRQIGKMEGGVQDVTINKPKLEDWITLSTTIAAEGVKVKDVVEKAKEAAEEMKAISQIAKNPLKAAKSAKVAKAAAGIIKMGSTATPILLEESADQVKSVQRIIQEVKSGKNI